MKKLSHWLIKQLAKSETCQNFCCAVISESGMTISFNPLGPTMMAWFNGEISDEDRDDIFNRKISLDDAIARAAARS